MTTFNTGNALGSTDPRDLSDNAENLDRFVNGPDSEYNDRLEVPRKSLSGMEDEFTLSQNSREGVFVQYLLSSGYTGTGTGGAIENYASGIEVTQYNQLINDGGEFWRADASTTLPYTTTGAGMPEGGAFVSAGDGALRQDLISANAAGVIYGRNGKTYRVVSAVLRQDTAGSGWYAIDDAGHAPVGLDPVTPVSESSGDIVLNYDFTSQKIGSLVITADEGYSALGLLAGASVGDTSAFISLHAPFGVRTSGTSAAAQGIYGTKGVDWDAVVDSGAGTITVSHGVMVHSDNQGGAVALTIEDSEADSTQLRIKSSSKTGYVLQNYGPLAGNLIPGGTIYFDGTGTVTAAWDGVDTLTITHPTAVSAYDAQVTSFNPQYHAAVRSRSATTIDVQYFDIAAGALYTGASHPPATINWSRVSSFCEYPIGSQVKTFSSRLGLIKVPAGGVSGVGRNLWVFGLFEVS